MRQSVAEVPRCRLAQSRGRRLEINCAQPQPLVFLPDAGEGHPLAQLALFQAMLAVYRSCCKCRQRVIHQPQFRGQPQCDMAGIGFGFRPVKRGWRWRSSRCKEQRPPRHGRKEGPRVVPTRSARSARWGGGISKPLGLATRRGLGQSALRENSVARRFAWRRGFRSAKTGKNSKRQPPTSREAPNSKHQTFHEPQLLMGAWLFSGAWSLEFGVFFSAP